MNPTRHWLLVFFLVLIPATALSSGELPSETLHGDGVAETVPLVIHSKQGPRRLNVEVARSLPQQSKGLMERDGLAWDSGMLFLYDRTQSRDNGFWMYLTRVPLDIAFIDEAGLIAEIRRMEPCTSAAPWDCPVTRPGVNYQAALEVNAGWFEKMGVAVGDRVDWEHGSGIWGN